MDLLGYGIRVLSTLLDNAGVSKWFSKLYSHQQFMRILTALYPHQHLEFSDLQHFCNSSGCTEYSAVILIGSSLLLLRLSTFLFAYWPFGYPVCVCESGKLSFKIIFYRAVCHLLASRSYLYILCMTPILSI